MFEYSLMCSLSEHLVQIYFWSDIRNIEFFWNTYQVIYAEQKLKQVTQMSCLDYKTVFGQNHCFSNYGTPKYGSIYPVYPIYPVF